MNLVSGNWWVRENRKLSGDGYYTFSHPFSFSVCILGVTTNLNPKNVVGYIYPVLKIPLLGGEVELGERIVITNKYPKIILKPEVSDIYFLKFRFAMPLGHCQVKIWESDTG